ncbi:DUF222 domain-containing protein [Cellulomonas hominis]
MAGRLEAIPGSQDLVDVLGGLEVAEVTDADLVEMVAGWDRVRSWALARQAVAVGELLARRGSGHEGEHVVDEVAARLGRTRASAGMLVALASGITMVPAVGDALRQGRIDERKAHVLLDGAGHLPIPARTTVIESVLPQAPDLTAPQLKARLRRAEITHDPAAAHTRHVRARQHRFVRIDPDVDAMAWISAYLPAVQAQAMFTTLDLIATQATTPEDTRTLDARRADTLIDLIHLAADTHLGAPTRAPDASTNPGAGAGAGGGAGASGGAALQGPETGDAGAGASVCAGMTLGLPALAPRDPATGTGTGSTRSGRPTRRSRAPEVQVTIAATTLLGLNQAPAELTGYGPIPAPLARDLATDATWRRLITDPTTGQLTERTPTTYRPSPTLAATIRARDTTCRFPGCRIPAWRTDLDHITPYNPTQPPQAQTTPDNLHPLCRTHHRLKTHTTWTVHRDPTTGHTTWTAPTGHTYLVPPHTTDPTIQPPPARPDQHRPTPADRASPAPAHTDLPPPF